MDKCVGKEPHIYYIYGYKNKINGKYYVGRTNNIERRKKEHKSSSYNSRDPAYNFLSHKKVREYGIENFSFEILEEIESNNITFVDEREQFWIALKKSYVKDNGYNLTKGGFSSERNHYTLAEKELSEVKFLIKNGKSFDYIGKKFNISKPFISSINTGVYFKDSNEHYPLFKYYKTNDEYLEVYEDIKYSSLSLADIAKKFNMSYSMIKKINSGVLRKGLSEKYPIREKNQHLKNRASRIKELLLNSEKTI